jgi:pyruvate dehydrogenase E2 component (dihydrolipoamide acetyltransferase)
MLQSHLEIPPVTQSCFADVTELMELCKKNNTGGTRISVNDFIIMAAAKTLKEQTRINASYTEEGLLVKKHINIGVAVALPEGLIVPVIKDADRLALREISAQARELANKAKQGRLSPDDYSGGTFTISNLGMMGVTSFTPIINQPEIAILGVCAAEQKLEMDDSGNIVKKMKMGLSLTYDHRCIDGAQAAIFSNRIVELLENPAPMIF